MLGLVRRIPFWTPLTLWLASLKVPNRPKISPLFFFAKIAARGARGGGYISSYTIPVFAVVYSEGSVCHRSSGCSWAFPFSEAMPRTQGWWQQLVHLFFPPGFAVLCVSGHLPSNKVPPPGILLGLKIWTPEMWYLNGVVLYFPL